jgi:membrane protein implicated in regulation of membrane protease activity
MRKYLFLVCLLLVSLVLSGCIDSTTKVTVNGDGSGLITETMGMSKKMVQQMQQMMPAEDGQPASGDMEIFKKEDFLEKASEYGPQVELIDFQKSSNDKSVYAQAVFKFDDINDIRIVQGNTPDMGGMSSPDEEQSYITFDLVQQAGATTLKVNIPQAEKSGSSTPPPPAATEPNAGQTAMMKQMFAGMHFAGLIEINGQITKTNASFVDKNKSEVVLYDIEFDKILDKPEILSQLQATQSPQEAQALLKDVEGLKVETNKDIEITFNPAAEAAVAGSIDETVAASKLSDGSLFSIEAVLAMLGGMMLIAAIVTLVLSIVMVWFMARILRKAGFAWPLALLLLIPGLNVLMFLILLMILAFVEWPIYEKFAAVSEHMNIQDDSDEPVIDENIKVEEEPEVKLDDTASFKGAAAEGGSEANGVPLPGESNHTKGTLDSDKLTQPQEKAQTQAPEPKEAAKPAAPQPEAEKKDEPEITLSSGGLASEKTEEEKKDELPPLEKPKDVAQDKGSAPGLPQQEPQKPKADKPVPDAKKQQLPKSEESPKTDLTGDPLPQAQPELKLPDNEDESELKLPDEPDKKADTPSPEKGEDADKKEEDK